MSEDVKPRVFVTRKIPGGDGRLCPALRRGGGCEDLRRLLRLDRRAHPGGGCGAEVGMRFVRWRLEKGLICREYLGSTQGDLNNI